jgi:hypothetical protein
MYRDNYGLFWFEKCIDLLSSHFSLFYFVSEMDRLVHCNTPGVIVLINLPCHHNALQSIAVRLTLLCIK